MEILFQDPFQTDLQGNGNRKKTGIQTSLIGLGGNLILAVSKIFTGLFLHSLSIFADGMNNLADSGSSCITLLSFFISARPSDQKHPFGHARFEYIASSVISVLIIYFGFSVFREALKRIQSPVILPMTWITGGVLVFSIAVKIAMAIFYRKRSQKLDSSVLEAAAADARSDVLLTSVILLTSILSPLLKIALDGPVSLLVGLVIVKAGAEILFSNFDRLMGKEPDPDFMEELKKEISAYPGVLGLHDLVVHDYGPGQQVVTCHVMVDGAGTLTETHDQMDRIERDLLKKRGILLTIHMDPVVLDDPSLLAMEGMIEKMVHEINPAYSLHDLQIRKTASLRRISFDLVIPWREGRAQEEEKEALQKVRDRLTHSFSSFELYVNIDHGERK